MKPSAEARQAARVILEARIAEAFGVPPGASGIIATIADKLAVEALDELAELLAKDAAVQASAPVLIVEGGDNGDGSGTDSR